MPPKKKVDQTSKKTEQKVKAKVLEDKTFGLKNKKGNKAQKYIQQVQKQVFNPNKKASDEQKERDAQLKKKEEEKKRQEELNTLFKPVQTIGKGVDPKSVLCAFFKQGACAKGAKCKFSHDLAVERKTQKRSMYDDNQKKDEMDDWDQDQLEDVVNQKHGAKNKSLPATTIICRHFLDAVENSKYGWFWECPGGDKCHYIHALPAGYVLTKDKKKMEEQKETITLEELIERERAKLGTNLTKVTLETFLVWKKKKKQEKVKAARAKDDKKKKDMKQGKMFGVSGRDLFTFNPDLIGEDDADADGAVMERESDESEDGEIVDENRDVKNIDLSTFAFEAGMSESGTTITAAPSVDHGERFADMNYLLQERGAATTQSNGTDLPPVENGKLSEAAGASSMKQQLETDRAIAAAMSATVNGIDEEDVPIDENLFDDDLDDLDEDLDTLEL